MIDDDSKQIKREISI